MSNSTDYLTLAQEYDLITRAQAGDNSAAEELLEAHAGQIHKCARAYWRPRQRLITYEDCFQIACAGAMKGLQKFDVTTGNKFLTYATWWIRQELGRSGREAVCIMHVPHHVAKDHEIKPVKSLDVSRSNSHQDTTRDTSLGALLASKLDADSDDRKVELLEAKQTYSKLLKCLTDRHRQIIELRFAGMTLEDCGKELGVTRERIRQLERKALNRLTNEAKRLGLNYNGLEPLEKAIPTRDASSIREDYIDKSSWIDPVVDIDPTLLRGVVYVFDKAYVAYKHYAQQNCPDDQIISLTGLGLGRLKRCKRVYLEELNGNTYAVRQITHIKKDASDMSNQPTPTPTPTPTSDLRRDTAFNMFAEGKTCTEINNETGIGRVALTSYLAEYKSTRPDAKCKCSKPLGHRGLCKGCKQVGGHANAGNCITNPTIHIASAQQIVKPSTSMLATELRLKANDFAAHAELLMEQVRTLRKAADSLDYAQEVLNATSKPTTNDSLSRGSVEFENEHGPTRHDSSSMG